jgi:hypothetical protein
MITKPAPVFFSAAPPQGLPHSCAEHGEQLKRHETTIRNTVITVLAVIKILYVSTVQKYADLQMQLWTIIFPCKLQAAGKQKDTENRNKDKNGERSHADVEGNCFTGKYLRRQEQVSNPHSDHEDRTEYELSPSIGVFGLQPSPETETAGIIHPDPAQQQRNTYDDKQKTAPYIHETVE